MEDDYSDGDIYRETWFEISDCSSQTESVINWFVEHQATLSHSDDNGIQFTIGGELHVLHTWNWIHAWWWQCGYDGNDKPTTTKPKFIISLNKSEEITFTVGRKVNFLGVDDFELAKWWMKGYEARQNGKDK